MIHFHAIRINYPYISRNSLALCYLYNIPGHQSIGGYHLFHSISQDQAAVRNNLDEIVYQVLRFLRLEKIEQACDYRDYDQNHTFS